MASDYDNPWKEALNRFLPAMLAFFFPEVYAGIDWNRGYHPLDKEFRKLVPDAETGKLFADMLFQVWRKDGSETWVLIHIEVQSQREEDFPERNFIYFYRIFDSYRLPVVSLAILGDDRPDWRPNRFNLHLWGCSNTFVFPVVKLLDYAGQEKSLEINPSPCAAIVLAHLKTLETKEDPPGRQVWKTRLIKGLFDRGLNADDIRQLFRLIDWMMILPKDLEITFKDEIYQFEEDRKMPYVTSIERLAREDEQLKTLKRGIKIGLEHRFGTQSPAIVANVESIDDLDLLWTIQQKLLSSAPTEEIAALLPKS
jgi:hypothetical protein